MSEYHRWRPIVWRVFIGSLVVFWLGAAFLAGKALATELPKDTSLWPQEGLVLWRIVPTAEDANRLCNPDEPRIFATACVRNGVMISQTPCDFTHERAAKEQCHELIHLLMKLAHKDGGPRLVWYATK